MIKKFIYIIIILLLGLVGYLSFFGISTDKFNQNIEKKFEENYPGIKLKLNNVKIVLNIQKISVDIEIDKPLILTSKEKIKLKNVSTTYDLKSFFKREFAIKNLYIDSEKNKIKEIVKLLRSYKDSTQLLIVEKIIKSGDSKISIKLNFDENGKLLENKYEISANINNLSIELFNKQKIDKISANINYSQNKIEITNLKSDYQDIQVYSDKILISKINKNYFVEGNLNNNESIISQSLIKKFLKNNNLKNIILSSKNNFNFSISKKFKVSDLKFNSKLKLNKAEYEFDNLSIKKYIPDFGKKIIFLDQSININYNKKILFDGYGNFLVGKKKDNIKYKFELNKDNLKFDLDFLVKEIPFKIDLINFFKNENETSNIKIVGERKKNNLRFKKINIIRNNDKIDFENINFSQDFHVKDFKKIYLEYLGTNQIKNDILIKRNKKNNYLIKGKNFDLSKIINQILFEDTNNSKIFDDKEKTFQISFQKNNIDISHHILNLQGNFKIKGSNIYDLSLSSSFPNKDILSMSIKTKNQEKVTTFYSEQAKPFVKKYKFVKGFEGGKLDFYSVKKNKLSKSQLKIFEFNLKELPALTKILTLASLQGIADILSGDGVSFDELEINFTNKNNLMKIEELYAIGPAISILMEGYVQKDELVSLKGTLVPATTINKFVGSIPILGDILVGKKTGEGVFGVSFKLKGPPKDIKTSVNPIKTLTPRFITRTLEKIKQTN